MTGPEPWYVRVRRALLRFWRTEDPRLAAVRDVSVAAGIVILLLGVVWGYTGQPFPKQMPLVVVESGSMMHGKCQLGLFENCFRPEFENAPFGRVGTIDPGDLVFVKRVRSLEEVEPAFGDGARGGYGGHGDVLVYKPGGSSQSTPIIHRAMLRVDVEPDPCRPNASPTPCKYIIRAACSPGFAAFTNDTGWEKYCRGSSDPITLTLHRDGLTIQLTNFPCPSGATCVGVSSGFVTKGDNNPGVDQPGIAPGPVELDWIIGKARGEIPWFGLIKLALYGNDNYKCRAGQLCSDPNRAPQWTIFRATAPWDIWVSLFIAVTLLIVLPVGVDYAINKWRTRRDQN